MKWEYKVVEGDLVMQRHFAAAARDRGRALTYAQRMRRGLDSLGKRGWELCGYVDGAESTWMMIFKRRVDKSLPRVKLPGPADAPSAG